MTPYIYNASSQTSISPSKTHITLPYDVLDLIFDPNRFQLSCGDIYCCILVCRDWYIAGIPHLYEKITGIKDKQTDKLLALVASDGSICSLVHAERIRHLVVNWTFDHETSRSSHDIAKHRTNWGRFDREWRRGNRGKLLRAALCYLPNLKSLEIYVHHSDVVDTGISSNAFRESDFLIPFPFSLQSFATNLVCDTSMARFLHHQPSIKSLFLFSGCTPDACKLMLNPRYPNPSMGCPPCLPNLKEFGFLDIQSASLMYPHNFRYSPGDLNRTSQDMYYEISPLKKWGIRRCSPQDRCQACHIYTVHPDGRRLATFHWHLVDGDMARPDTFGVAVSALPPNWSALLRYKVRTNKGGIYDSVLHAEVSIPRCLAISIQHQPQGVSLHEHLGGSHGGAFFTNFLATIYHWSKEERRRITAG